MADWMAFNVADYVANTLHLTTRQHGAYILLICAAWSGKGALPGTDAGLMAIAKLNAKEWKEDGEALKAFLTRRDEQWIHERVEFEWNDAQSLIAAKSRAGKEGARKRWQGRANGKRMAEPSQTHRQTDAPIPLPLPNSEANASGADAPIDPIKVLFDEGVKLLTENGCKPANARSIIGKWRRDHGDEATQAAIKAARTEGCTEPIAWITQRFSAKPRETWDQRRIREGLEVLRQ